MTNVTNFNQCLSCGKAISPYDDYFADCQPFTEEE